jgi:hypothetical protein
MEISRQHPLPASLRVREARDAYLSENGFTVAAYDDKWTQASAFGLRFRVPNTRRHRWAIKMHDLHHVATGYGTDLAGEAEISAWELRRGLRQCGLYVAGIVTLGALTGLLIAPRRTVAAYRASADRPSLFAQSDADDLLELTVGELRARLGVPQQGLATQPRALHTYAPPLAGQPATAQ